MLKRSRKVNYTIWILLSAIFILIQCTLLFGIFNVHNSDNFGVVLSFFIFNILLILILPLAHWLIDVSSSFYAIASLTGIFTVINTAVLIFGTVLFSKVVFLLVCLCLAFIYLISVIPIALIGVKKDNMKEEL